MIKKTIALITVACVVFSCTSTQKKEAKTETPQILAATPPMGWNSWDCFGSDVNEQQVKANAGFMAANLKESGWEYVVVDLGWYIDPALNILTFKNENPPQAMDEFGRLIPDAQKFSSATNGQGFKPLADYVHGLGLKFGIHIMRGIPWQAVDKNVTIKGTDIKAATVSNANDTCVWYDGMFGVDYTKAGAQEYYNSIVALYAEWGVDYIKADDMSRPYHKDEISLLSNAIKNCGRPIVLSLSPGASPVAEVAHLQASANLWRVSNDFWDDWQFLKQAFEYARLWQPYIKPGAWPDADMLPLGKLRVTGSDDYVAGFMKTTPDKITNEFSRFTQDEQITLMTLWCIIKSPLMFGGNLPETDDFTLKLITNKDALHVNQHSVENRELRFDETSSVWTAKDPENGTHYIALFNTGEMAREIPISTKEFTEDKEMQFLEIWNGTAINAKEISIEVPPHGSKFYKVK